MCESIDSHNSGTELQLKAENFITYQCRVPWITATFSPDKVERLQWDQLIWVKAIVSESSCNRRQTIITCTSKIRQLVTCMQGFIKYLKANVISQSIGYSILLLSFDSACTFPTDLGVLWKRIYRYSRLSEY